MSERSKGDVSPRVNNNANRIVKNSLLSASVTGLSFDDFPNKPLLLPAAPPVVHAPPPQPTNALIAGILNREPKTLVTVGQSSSIDDSETLDEINLNASSSDDSAAAAANASINPYLNVGDGNANPLLEPPTNTDSLLSQAASSFGALPSVASNVFSTFSKRIYAGSREADEQQPQPQLQLQPQLEIQPTYIQQVGQVPPAVAPFYAAPPAAVGEAAPEPPKFYAPTELPNLGAGPSLPPTSAGQNTYRITARKKLYAPIPGLSEQQQQQQQHQQQQVQSAGAPFQTPPYPAPAAFEPPVPAPPVPEERKSGGGLFSLTNLVPTGVLQNISGLVQSATGRTTTSEPPSASAPVSYNAPNPGYFDITTASGAASQPTSNYFTPTAITAPVGAAPAATNYFVPTAAPPTVGGFFNPLAVGSAPGAVPPPAVGCFYNPLAVASPAPPGGIFNPLAVTSTSEVVHPPTVGGFFTPAAVAPPSTAAPSSAFAQPPPVAAPLTLGQPPAATAAPVVAQSLPVVPTTVAAPPQPLAAPPAIAPPPAFTQPSTLVESTSAFAPPPVAVASAVPPPAAGLTSYRLQKGTRLYKSPLTAQETAPPTATFGQQAGFTATPFAPTSSTPAAIFNPFGGVSGTAPFAALAPTISPAANAASSQEVELVPTATSLFTPQTNTAVVPSINTSLFAPIQAQEVPLFPSSTAESTQGLPLYPPAVPQSVSEPAATNVESAQEVQLFAVPPTSASFQGVSLFPSPTAESSQPPKAEAAQEVQLFAAPPTSASFQSAPLFPSPSAESSQPPKAAPAQEVPSFAAPPTNASFQASSLFGSSTAEATQGLPLYPPVTPQATIEPQLPQTEQSVQEVPLFAAPPASDTAATSVQTVDLFASSSTPSSLFKPEEAEQKVPTAPQSESKEVTTSALPSANSKQNSTLFVPVPTAEIGQAIALYPPEATVAAPAEFSQGIPLFAPGESTDSAATSTTQSTTVYSTEAPPTLNANSLFAPSATTESQEAAVSVANVTQSQIATTSVALTTQTTTTFFNPFAQTVTTPLPQDLLPPPIGFVAPDAKQLFEAQTIEPVLSEAEKVETLAATAAAPPPPPPTSAAAVKQSDATSQANPFRKSNETVSHPSAAPSPLQSFFTPAGNSSDFNFFAAPPKEEPPQQAVGQFPELPPQLNVAPPPLAQEQAATVDSIGQSSHALGFEQLISDSQQATQQIQNSNEKVYQNSSVNSFSGYFGGPVEVAPPPIVQAQPPPQSTGNFFDHFAGSAQGQEDQRIQNFFNNPPQNDQPSAPGELKYDIVHSGLPTKHFEERSQTSVSNQVEPPSSACSDFSTATKGAVAQQPQQEVQPERQVEDLQQLYQGELPDEILQQLRMASEKGQAIAPPADAVAYTPALLHWFFKRSIDGKFVWTPFSHYDSALLETSLTSDESDSSCIVPVEGGRYDVNIKERTKTPVFWDGKAIEVRRCSWFYKAVDSKYVPYAEETAAALEVEYKRATETGEWLKKIPLPNGEQVTMHGPNVIVHFMPPSHADTWGGPVQSSSRPLVVKRDLNDFKIQQGESQRVDHLLFMVHGIGSVCDLKMRNVEEVVDDFRIIAQQLVQSHYKNSTDMGLVGRVEVLPIEWHGHLHSEELGIDEKLKSITLESIPRLRNFTNDTLLDVLFYTSPKYCQKIMNTVADALNEVYLKYRMRHPEFNGGVSLAGHSLGSLILFDLLCHQEPLKECEEENKENPDHLPQKHSQNMEPKQVQLPNNDQMLPKQVSYAMGLGPAGTGQPVINYTQLIFHPKKFFALGSPIGMFVTIRGIDKLGLDFRLPTCPGFYNIFHPFDPVAYRIEALVNADMKGIRPVLIPHHKGRKRMHLELKETMTRVGADIKQRFMDTFKSTLDSVHFLATVTKVKREAEESLEKANSSQVFERNTEDQDESSVATTSTYARNRTDSESTTNSDPEFIELDFPLGKLNDSKRVDYVLQEAPLEFINEYLFALSSHVCYWASEDTILFVMKEIYAGLGISTDSQVPQQSMTIERPSSRTNSVSQSLLPIKIIQRIFNLCNSNLVNGLNKLRSLTLSEINPQRITV